LALANLRAADKLSIEGIRSLAIEELQALLRPSGFFRQKAARLKTFLAFLDERYDGDLTALLATPQQQLRDRLLTLPGVGRETADSILLYAAHRPVFVIDLYTRRLLFHEQIFSDSMEVDYDLLRARIETAFLVAFANDAERTRVFNEFHALIVQHGKQARAVRATS
jgi:endonuclease III related protein